MAQREKRGKKDGGSKKPVDLGPPLTEDMMGVIKAVKAKDREKAVGLIEGTDPEAKDGRWEDCRRLISELYDIVEKETDPEIKVIALDQLEYMIDNSAVKGESLPERAVPLLTTLALHDESPEVRKRALNMLIFSALIEVDGEKIFDTLIHAVTSDPDKSVREQAKECFNPGFNPFDKTEISLTDRLLDLLDGINVKD